MVLKVGAGDAETVLLPGDLLLKISDGTAVQNVIALGQFLTNPRSRHANTIHTAIYTRDHIMNDAGSGMIADSSGHGLLERAIGRCRPPHERNTWKVYRFYGDGSVVDAAADIASILVARHAEDSHFGTYDYAASITSVVKPTGNPLKGSAEGYQNYMSLIEKRCFFCSNFVVACYAVASEMAGKGSFYAIPKQMENVTPGELAEYFEKVDEGGGGGGWWKRLGGTTARLQA